MKEYITDTGTTYAIIPVLADNEWRITNLEYIYLSGQIIITNLVNPMELFNHLESSYKLVMTKYGISLTGELKLIIKNYIIR